jgi:DNA-binding MarR family transcriptional regulator
MYIHLMGSDVCAPAASCQTVAAVCPCFALRKASRAVTQLFDEALRPAGLHATQFTLLVALRLLDEVRVCDLADELVTDPTTLSRNLMVLRRRGLVTLTAAGDRRSRLVVLTDAGHAAVTRALPLWEATYRRLEGALPGPEAAELLVGLDALTRLALSAREEGR